MENHAGWAKKEQFGQANHEMVRDVPLDGVAGLGGRWWPNTPASLGWGASQVMGLSVLALGKLQTNQDELGALLDGAIRENKYPFVETISIPLTPP